MRNYFPATLGLLAAISLLATSASGQTLPSADFSAYTDGALVGQNGWQQYGGSVLRPLTVSGGAVSWAGGNTDDGQDAVLVFGSQIAQPESGTTILNYDLTLRVSAAGASPSYFAALNTLTTTTPSGNFQNARIAARATGAGFQFGARVNGQGGYPYAYGTELTYNQTYALRAEIGMVAGNANDFINLYVGPDFNNLSLYATAVYSGTGTVGDPLFGGMLISQFGSPSVNESGVSISSMAVSLVPEPSSAALFALGALVLAARRRQAK